MPPSRPPSYLPLQVRMLASGISFAIVFLAAANGIFTYSGALLYVDHWLYALLFAAAVQLAISLTLIALPYVRGLSRLVLLLVYVAAFILSTLSAYTYIYNVSQPAAVQDLYAVDVPTKTRIADALGLALQTERQVMDARELELAQLQQTVKEEQARGNHSGRGPGRGSEYARKLDAYEAAEVALATPRRNFQAAQMLYGELTERLSGPVSVAQRQELATRIAAIRALTQSPVASQMLSRLAQEEVGKLLNPVERALAPLLSADKRPLTLWVSLIWAGIFDLLALFLGLIRYYLLRPPGSLMNDLYQRLVNLGTFFIRVKNTASDARLQYHDRHSVQSREFSLDAPDMQLFATALAAGSELSTPVDGDTTEPLRTLLGYMQPLDLPDVENGVGVSYECVEQNARLKPLVAILLQHNVFVNRRDSQCYLLNANADMAHKVLIFMRLGMKDQGNLALVRNFTAELPASA